MRFHALPTVSAVAGLIAMLDGASLVAMASIPQDDPPKPQLVLVRVEDEAGQPIEDATVTLTYRSQSPETYFESKREVLETDQLGQAIPEFPSDALRLTIRIDKPGRISQMRHWRTGGLVPDEIALVLDQGIAIGGVVHDEQGNPIKDVRVELWIESRRTAFVDPPPGRNNLYVDNQIAPRTNAEGKWRYEGVPDDAIIRVRLIHPKYCSEEEFVRSRPNLNESQYRDGTAELVMRAGLELVGRVVDPENRPVAKAVVLIEKAKDSQGRRQSVETNRHGDFSFRIPPDPSSYRIAAIAAGWAPKVESVTMSESAPPKIEIRLDKGSPLRIRVVDSDGKPVRAAVSPLMDASVLFARREVQGQPDPVFPHGTDENGIFEWLEAPDGKFKVWVAAQDFQPKVLDVTAGGDEITVQLESAARVIGRCVDKSTGEPVKRFLVMRLLQGVYPDRSSQVVGVNGVFVLEQDLLNIECQLLVEAAGYRTLISSQTVGGKTPLPTELKFELEPAVGVTGTIVDRNGDPVAGALVSVRTSSMLATVTGNTPPEQLRLLTGRNGRFEFPAQVDRCSIAVLAKQGSAKRSFSRDESELGEIKLEPNGTVRGIVLRNGVPVEGAPINLHYGLGLDHILTDAEGRFVFPDVPSGDLVLFAAQPNREGNNRPDTQPISQEIHLGPGQTANVTVELEK